VRRCGAVDEVVVVGPRGDRDAVESLCGPAVVVVDGGDTRQASVAAGLRALGPDVDAVLVHDAARCLTPSAVFTGVLAALAAGHQAVVPGVPVTDTLRQRRGGVVDRESMVAVQTPQGFARHVLDAAHEAATGAQGQAATDDAGLVEAHGVPVHVVPGHEESFKVTRPIDLVLAEGLVSRSRR
jgi:2-C-methyl-D-erythritol 4-phosphate cytidylyltransferase